MCFTNGSAESKAAITSGWNVLDAGSKVVLPKSGTAKEGTALPGVYTAVPALAGRVPPTIVTAVAASKALLRKKRMFLMFNYRLSLNLSTLYVVDSQCEDQI